VFDTATELGLDVRFTPIASLGGMFERHSNVILVPTDRPRGRQAFTCAHELAHWYLGHGTKLDEFVLIDDMSDREPEELLANLFAAFLLMPARAVEAAFSRRKWNASAPSPFEVYVVAVQLGVGYETLVSQLRWSLGLLSEQQADQLARTSPAAIRASILGETCPDRFLVVADRAWRDVPIDLQVGDFAIVPDVCRIEGRSIRSLGPHDLGRLVMGCTPGISRIESADGDWASFVRVSRRHFSGRSIYRHLEEPDDVG
jgi:hypothetical protein